jgi:hypothetical protein
MSGNGYNWERGISNNAVNAYKSGKLPKSKLPEAWMRRAVDAGAVDACEWHHTSGKFNETQFYDVADFAKLNPDDFSADKVEEKIIKFKSKKDMLQYIKDNGVTKIADKHYESMRYDYATIYEGKYGLFLSLYGDATHYIKYVKFNFDTKTIIKLTEDEIKEIEIDVAKRREVAEKGEKEMKKLTKSKAKFVEKFPERSQSDNYYKAGQKPTSEEKKVGLIRRRFELEPNGHGSYNTIGIQEKWNGENWEIQSKKTVYVRNPY